VQDAAELANLAASRVVLKSGTAQTRREELLEAVRSELRKVSCLLVKG